MLTIITVITLSVLLLSKVNSEVSVGVCKIEIDKSLFISTIIDSFKNSGSYMGDNSNNALLSFLSSFFRKDNSSSSSAVVEIEESIKIVDCFDLVSFYDYTEEEEEGGDIEYIVLPSNKLTIDDMFVMLRGLGYSFITEFFEWMNGGDINYCNVDSISFSRSVVCLLADLIETIKDFLTEHVDYEEGNLIFDITNIEYYDDDSRRGEGGRRFVKNVEYSFKTEVRREWSKSERTTTAAATAAGLENSRLIDETRERMKKRITDRYNHIRNNTVLKKLKTISTHVMKEVSPVLGYGIQQMSREVIRDTVISKLINGNKGRGRNGILTEDPDYISECHHNNNNNNNLTEVDGWWSGGVTCISFKDEYKDITKNFFAAQGSLCVWEGFGPQHNNIICWDLISVIHSTWNIFIEVISMIFCLNYPNPRNVALGYNCLWTDGLPDSNSNARYPYIKILTTTIFERLFPLIDFVGVSCEESRGFPGYFSGLFRLVFGLDDHPYDALFCLVYNIFWVAIIVFGFGIITIILGVIAYYLVGFFIDAGNMRKMAKKRQQKLDGIYSKMEVNNLKRIVRKITRKLKKLDVGVKKNEGEVRKTKIFFKSHLSEHILIEERHTTQQDGEEQVVIEGGGEDEEGEGESESTQDEMEGVRERTTVI